jgi:Cu/Zn superoxide dismutase
VAPLSALVLLASSLQAVVLPASLARADVVEAQAVLANAAGTPVGTVDFTQEGTQVRVRVVAQGLTPGWHGFHIHETGNCSAPSFASAGGHLGAALGQSQPNHKGDMPSLLAGTDGTVRTTFRTDHFAVADLFPTGGTAVVIHAAADNFANIPIGTNPDQYQANTPTSTSLTAATGNAGARVACGVVGAGTSPLLAGYLMAAADGGVFAFGDAQFQGGLGAIKLNSPIVGLAASSDGGFYLGGADGGVFTFGDAPFEGSQGGNKLNAPIVGISTPPVPARAELLDASGQKVGTVSFYAAGAGTVGVVVEAKGLPPGWHGFHVHEAGSCAGPTFASAKGHLGAADGQIQPNHKGDLPQLFVNADGTARAAFRTDRLAVADLFHAGGTAVVIHTLADNFNNIPTAPADGYTPNSATATSVSNATGNAGARIACGVVQPAASAGYWLAAKDGGVFAFGDAPFRGSAGGMKLNSPIVGMAAAASGNGYYLVGADGGVFAYGDAPFLGSTGGMKLNSPIVAMGVTRSGQGYYLVAADGGVFAYGDAQFLGSTGSIKLNSPIVSMAVSRSVDGYRLVAADGGVFAYGEALFAGGLGGTKLNSKVVAAFGPR